MSSQWILEPATSARMATNEVLESDEGNVAVWPTTVDRFVNIKTNGKVESILIFDLLGRTQYLNHDVLGKTDITIDLGDVRKGMLVLKLKSSTDAKTVRLLKN